jgi:hypothetical protein
MIETNEMTTAEEQRRIAEALGLTIPSPAPQRPAVEAEPAALSFALKCTS